VSRHLIEIQHVSQIPGEPRKRWFQSDYFDLFVWYNKEDNSLWGFRLCYDRCYGEHALTWKSATGSVSHHSVEATRPVFQRYAGTAMLGDAEQKVPAVVLERFDREGTTLPDDLRELIRGVLTRV
jgi:hypothetical protein